MKSDNFFTSFFPRPLSFRSTALLTAFIFLFTSSLVISPEELFAAPVVEAPQTAPTSIEPNAPVNLLVTVPVVRDQADPIVVPGGAYLMQVDPQSGAMITNFGAMRDDGLEGDAVAGDDVWSLRIAIEEAPADGLGLKASIAFERVIRRVESPITVVPVVQGGNQPPFFTSKPLTEAVEGAIYYDQAEAEDPENGELIFSLEEGPLGMTVTESGFVTWTPRDVQVGDMDVVLKVADPFGASAMQPFTIDVADYNKPPVITSLPVRSVKAGEIYQYDVEAFDDEGTAITYSLDGTPPQTMTIDPDTGLIEWPTTESDSDIDEVIVRATDEGGAFSTQTFGINIVTDPLVLLSPVGEFEVEVGGLLELTLEANYEKAGFRVTPSVPNSSLPVGTNKFSFSPTAEQVGVYNLGFEAVYAGMRAVNAVLITVRRVNKRPVLDEIQPQTVNEGAELIVPVNANDPDGDKLEFFTPGLNLPGAYFDHIRRVFVFKPDFNQSGNYEVLIRVSDGVDNAERTLQIEVLDVPSPAVSDLELVVDPVQSPNFRNRVPVSGSVIGEIREPPILPPVILSGLSPSSIHQGRSSTVDITGFNTDFNATTTTFDFGDGVTVDAVEVFSSTSAKADITADFDAAIGTRNVLAVQESEKIASAVIFEVLGSASQVFGQLIDSFTQQPLEGARVVANGTGVVDITDSEGKFSLDGLGLGSYQLVATLPNYAVGLLEFAVDDNVPLDVGVIEVDALARPFVPGGTIERGATLASVIDRGASSSTLNLNLEQTKALVLDTILSIPGDDYGAIDEAGNQLNPDLEGGDGMMTLTPFAVDMVARKMLEGNVYTLGQVIEALYGSFGWMWGESFDRESMLVALQGAVNRAWEKPGDPYNAVTLLAFNEGTTLQTTAPELTFDTPLNYLQSFLLVSSFLSNFAVDLNAGYDRLYEENGRELPKVQMDYQTLEHVLTIGDEVVRVPAVGSDPNSTIGPPVIAAADIGEFVLGGEAYAEDAGPNGARPERDITAHRTWGEIFSPGGWQTLALGLVTAIGFVVLGAFLFGFASAAIAGGALLAGFAGTFAFGTAAAFFGGLALTMFLGYVTSVLARGFDSYFGPRAVEDLEPPAPEGVRHEVSEDAKKVFIQFEKSPLHQERDRNGGTSPDNLRFVPGTTLIDLLEPGIDLNLVEFEYQLWRIEENPVPLAAGTTTRLVSVNAIDTGLSLGTQGSDGNVESHDLMQFVLPLERLNEGENVFKIRTVMFYRGYLLFEDDGGQRTAITRADLGLPSTAELPPEYKNLYSFGIATAGAGQNELNTLTANHKQAQANLESAYKARNALQASDYHRDAGERISAEQGKLSLAKDDLDKYTDELERLRRDLLTFDEKAKIQRFEETYATLREHMKKGGKFADITDPQSDFDRNLRQTLIDQAGGQAEFDRVLPKLREVGDVYERHQAAQDTIRPRRRAIRGIDLQANRIDNAYRRARIGRESVVINLKYQYVDAPTPENPAPKPQTVDRIIEVTPNGDVIDAQTGERQSVARETQSLKDLSGRQKRINGGLERNPDISRSVEDRPRLELRKEFIDNERIRDAKSQIQAARDRLKEAKRNLDASEGQIRQIEKRVNKEVAEAHKRIEEARGPVTDAKADLKEKKTVAQKVANSKALRALNSPGGQGVVAVAQGIGEAGMSIRERLKMLPSNYSKKYILYRNGDQVQQYSFNAPPIDFNEGPAPNPDPFSGVFPRVREAFRLALESANLFRLPTAFAQGAPFIIPPFFESDPHEDHALAFFTTLADPDNPKNGFLARQFPFTAPPSWIRSMGFPSDFIATDSRGFVYALNGNSYDNFGGRIFRFRGSPVTREHIGQINYFSRLLGFTRRVRPIAIEVGEYKDPDDDTVYENLFIANREEGIPLLSGGAPPPNRIMRLPMHYIDTNAAFADGQNRDRIISQPYATHPDFKFTGPSDFERDYRPRENDNDPPRPVYFSDEENIFAIKQLEGQHTAEVVKIVSIPGRRWSGLAQDINGHFYFADYNSGEIFLLPGEDLDDIVNGSNGEINSNSSLDFRAFLIKEGVDRPGDIELDTFQHRYVVSTPNGFEAFDIVMTGRYNSSNISTMVVDVLGQTAPVTLRPGRGNVFIVGRGTESRTVGRVRFRIKRRNPDTGAFYWSEEAMHLEPFGMTIFEGTLD